MNRPNFPLRPETFLVGRVFEFPGRPALRRILHALLWGAGLTGRVRGALTQNAAVVGRVYSGLGSNSQWGGRETILSPGMNHDDVRKVSFDVLQALASVHDPALQHRGCSLVDICAQPIWIVLERVEFAWQKLNRAYAAASRPSQLIVEDPTSIERNLMEAMAATKARNTDSNVALKIRALQPYWAGKLVAGCLRLLALGWALAHDARLPACHVHLSPTGKISKGRDVDGEPLFISFGAVSSRASFSIVWEFLETKGLPVNVVLPVRLQGVLLEGATKRGFICSSPRRVRPPGLLRTIRYFGVAGKVRRALKRSGICYHGTSVARLLDGGLSLFSMSSFPVVQAHMDVWHAELALLKPSVIVTGNNYDWRFKAVAALAKHKGIPTLSSLDGFGVESTLFAIGGAGNHCAVSEAMAGSMRQNGVPPEAIYVVGLPVYDRLSRLRSDGLSDIPASLTIDRHRPVVVVTSHHYIDARVKKTMVRCVLEVAGKNPEIQFVFKLHPDERDGLITSLVEKFGLSSTVQVSQDVDVFDVLSLASAVAVFGSASCGVEAIALGKPTLILDFSGHRLQLPYVDEGAAIGISRAEEFSSAIFLALDDQPTKARLDAAGTKFVERYLGRLDGMAAERAASVVETLMQRHTQDGENPTLETNVPAP